MSGALSVRAARGGSVSAAPTAASRLTRVPTYAAKMRDDAGRRAEDLFEGFPETVALFHRVEEAVSAIGDASVTVTKSQVAFRRRKGFAYVWRPGQYVDSEVPAVLSIALPREAKSDRFKEVVHPSANVGMHHIELRDASQVDDEIRAWLSEAYASAG